MSAPGQNRIKVTKNVDRKTVTLAMERRDSWGRVRDSFQFTISERQFDRALLDAQIIAPWNKVAAS